MTQPRIPPVPPDAWDDETRALLGTSPPLNIFATLAHHPKLMKRWMVFGNHVLAKSTLPARDRELLILRTGWDCQSEYEWSQHVGSVGRAREKGLDPAQIAKGGTAGGWDPFEVSLLHAADELYRDSSISDRTWSTLSLHFDPATILNVIVSVAQYRQVSIALNTFGVPGEPGDERLPLVGSN